MGPNGINQENLKKASWRSRVPQCLNEAVRTHDQEIETVEDEQPSRIGLCPFRSIGHFDQNMNVGRTDGYVEKRDQHGEGEEQAPARSEEPTKPSVALLQTWSDQRQRSLFVQWRGI